jgi:hypothetical protein
MKTAIKLIKNGFIKLFRKKSAKPQQENNTQTPYMLNPITKTWYDANDREVNEPKNYVDEQIFGINDYEDFLKYLGDTKTNWNLKSKGFYDLYAKYGLKMRK